MMIENPLEFIVTVANKNSYNEYIELCNKYNENNSIINELKILDFDTIINKFKKKFNVISYRPFQYKSDGSFISAYIKFTSYMKYNDFENKYGFPNGFNEIDSYKKENNNLYILFNHISEFSEFYQLIPYICYNEFDKWVDSITSI